LQQRGVASELAATALDANKAVEFAAVPWQRVLPQLLSERPTCHTIVLFPGSRCCGGAVAVVW
jgi:hypothetical protein